MIPEERLSTTPVPGAFLHAEIRDSPYVDYEQGGVALQDPSLGLSVKLWTLRYSNGDFIVSAPGVAPTVLFSRPGNVTWASLTFDQNMNPFVAFTEDGVSKFWWYDSTVPGQVFEESLIATAVTPCCCLDDRRPSFSANSDIILAYIRNNNLYYRQQRDRYLVEYLLRSGVGGRLDTVGMTVNYRLQFRLRDVLDVSIVPEAPYLADVVLDLGRQCGLNENTLDVRELYTDTVPGMKVAIDEGLDKPIDWLREIFHFDKANIDRKLHFRKRGRAVTLRIPYSDLVQGNPTALQQTIVDETKLPKLVNINHIDPAGGFGKNKQTASRRSNMVDARATKTIDSKIVLTADQAASAALSHLKAAWAEQITYKFSTTLRYTELTVTDVIEVEDARGAWHRIRLTDRKDDGSVISWEGKQDAGPHTYGFATSGNSLPPPTSTTPGLVGPTTLEIMNLPVLRTEDDELGVYVAMWGQNSAWYGAQFLLSTDGGTTYNEAFRVESPAVGGELLTDLYEDGGYLYPSAQTVEVQSNFPLSSTTVEGLYNNQNRAIIGDEVIQFLTATHLGNNVYRLSGLVRGRYNTATPTWPAGTRFVLFDSSVIFLRAERWMLGAELYVKPVSFGRTSDETVPVSYFYDTPTSQTEWPVSNLSAEWSGPDLVVTWIGRARLGTDVAPVHSKYFAGYRVKFSNGFEATTTNQTYTYAGAPGGTTLVSVTPINSNVGEIVPAPLVNPGFESGFSGWTEDPANTDTFEVITTAGAARSGSGVLRFTGSLGNEDAPQRLYNTRLAPPNTESFTARCYIRIGAMPTGGYVVARCFAEFLDSLGAVLDTTYSPGRVGRNPGGDFDWAINSFTRAADAPPGTEYVRLGLEVSVPSSLNTGVGSYEVFFDDFYWTLTEES